MEEQIRAALEQLGLNSTRRTLSTLATGKGLCVGPVFFIVERDMLYAFDVDDLYVLETAKRNKLVKHFEGDEYYVDLYKARAVQLGSGAFIVDGCRVGAVPAEPWRAEETSVSEKSYRVTDAATQAMAEFHATKAATQAVRDSWAKKPNHLCHCDYKTVVARYGCQCGGS